MKLRSSPLVTLIIVLLLIFFPLKTWSEEVKPSSSPPKGLRLEDLEQMALKNNPTVDQASARTSIKNQWP